MSNHAKLPLWDDKSAEQKLDTIRDITNEIFALSFADARKQLLDILDSATYWGEQEKDAIETMKQLIQKHPNIISQTCEVGHVIGSALVVDNQRRCLLQQHKELNRWMQFGGHAQYETDVAEIALREAKQATGLTDLVHFPRPDKPLPVDFEVQSVSATETQPKHLHLEFRYMVKTNQPETLNLHDKSKEFIWAIFDDILNPTDPDDEKLLSPSLYRLIAKCRERYGYQYPGNSSHKRK